MIRSRYIRLIDTLFISALIGTSTSSCSEQEEIDASPSLSDTEITFTLSNWKPIADSRANIFEGENDLLNGAKGGGNFTLHAYVAENSKKYIDGATVWYFKDPDNPSGSKWFILDDQGLPRTYFWPNGKTLNFFAYMPYKDQFGSEGAKTKEEVYKDKTGVTIGDYDKDSGMRFSCALPAIASDDDDKTLWEFVYAYNAGEAKKAEPVKLLFYHPFALINFKIADGSYRMTVKDFTFGNKNPNDDAYADYNSGIVLTGTFSTASKEWERGSKTTFTARIGTPDNGIRVPNDKNYNSLLSTNGFLVLPQELDGVTLTLNAQRDKGEQITGTFSFPDGQKWEAGKKYTYTVKYGDNDAEIYFNVTAEPWEAGPEQNIAVE